jgi:hypothetical protein
MEYPLSIPGFEGQSLVVKPPGAFSAVQLLVNGQPAQQGAKRGEMLLRANDGREVLAKWKPSFLDLPALDVGGQTVRYVEALKWYQYVWSGLPILMIFAGGVLGAVFGIGGFMLNTRVFRSNLSKPLQYAAVFGISAVVFAIYLVLALLIQGALR